MDFTIFYKYLKTNKLQILRFLVSGLIASGFNYLVYISTYLILNNILWASICGYLTGLIVSFIFAKIWVFKTRSKLPAVKSFSMFCVIYFLGGIEMSFVIIILNQLLDNYKVSWFFGAFIGALNNYFGSKYFCFKE